MTTLPLLADDVCRPAALAPLLDAEADTLARTFKALGDPARVKLMALIAASPNAEACVCDLTSPVGLSQPTVSHHMKQLVDAGLVIGEKRGRWTYYRAVPEALDGLIEAFAAVRA